MTGDTARRGFEQLVSRVDQAMVIVTARADDDGERAGCLVGFATQCSIEPPRYLVCLSRRNHTFRVAARTAVLAVHFPTAAERDLAALFGEQTGDDVDKLARCQWRPGPGGVPLLTRCRSWFAGAVLDRVDLGDHVGYLLEPVAASADAGFRPLGFQSVRGMAAGHAP